MRKLLLQGDRRKPIKNGNIISVGFKGKDGIIRGVVRGVLHEMNRKGDLIEVYIKNQTKEPSDDVYTHMADFGLLNSDNKYILNL